MARTISRQGVCAAIDAAELSFRACWATLVQIRGFTVSEDFGEDVLSFQSTLIDALSRIEDQRVAIKHEERRLIQEKGRLHPTWFAKRMATLKRYGEALFEALAIGRALGDGFAWMFYERDGALIDEHLKQERQVSVPTGVGGLGERTSAKNLRGLGGQLAVYHGTTTFLRIGDVSLVDLSTLRVCGIGEMKSQRVDAEQIEVRIELIADAKTARAMYAEAAPDRAPARQLPPKMQDRFERQRKTMRTALSAADEASKRVVDRRIEQQSEFHYTALDRLVRGCGWRRMSYTAPEPGLVMGALRSRQRGPLSRHLLGKAGDMTAKVADATPWLIKAMAPPHPHNGMIMGSVGAPNTLVLTGEGLPFTLWSAADETIEALLFGEVIAVTLYNPGHFWRAIETRGFKLSREEPRGEVRASREMDGRPQIFRSLAGFHRLTRTQLMSLPTVLNMVDDMLQVMQNPEVRGLRVRVRPQPIWPVRTPTGMEG